LTVLCGDGTFTLMKSKPTVEQFMTDFFQERTAALKMVLENRREYRLRYYHSECLWDSRRGGVEKSEAEKIVDVSPSDIGTDVISTGSTINRSRYRLTLSGESWLICAVDMECGHYRIFGASYDCPRCGGTGWLSWKDQTELLKRQEQHAARPTRPTPNEESEGSLFRDSAIEQFMTDHFRERTAVLRKEAEIHAEYVRHFYSQECDWTRWIASAEHSEIERILSIVPVDAGAHVTTNGFGFRGRRLRYNLCPAAQSWLIWKVDLECPVCSQQGRRVDCFWCGGTIWEHKKADGGRPRGEQPGDDPLPETPRWKI
jgi:hypothetical protein